MNDVTFYLTLIQCFFSEKPHCLQCPLYAQGDDYCMETLKNEIRYRRNKALEKEEEGKTDAVHLHGRRQRPHEG